MSKKLSKKLKDRVISQLETTAKLDGLISERDLRKKLYNLAVFLYREYHEAGVPASMLHPGLKAPKKVWDAETCSYVHEEVIKHQQKMERLNEQRELDRVMIAAKEKLQRSKAKSK